MAIILTIPQVTLPVGPGSRTSPAIPAGAVEYVIHLQQVGWPHVGDKAFDFVCEVALDGVNFQPLCSGDVSDASVPSRNGSTLDSFNIAVGPIPGVGTVGRKLRFSWDFAKSLTISGTLSAV